MDLTQFFPTAILNLFVRIIVILSNLFMKLPLHIRVNLYRIVSKLNKIFYLYLIQNPGVLISVNCKLYLLADYDISNWNIFCICRMNAVVPCSSKHIINSYSTILALVEKKNSRLYIYNFQLEHKKIHSFILINA